MLGRAGRILRDGAWLEAGRLRAYAGILLAVTIAVIVGWVAASQDGLDPLGKPLGTDFLSFWAASKLALAGGAGQVYRPEAHYAVQKTAFGPGVEYAAFFYPPVYLLVCLPLALLPYLASLVAWLGATGAAYGLVIRRYLRPTRVGIVPILAFPAVMLNLGHGQNGFLTAALFGGAVLLLERRPVVAGLLLGALIFKPHIGLLIPVALICIGAWSTIAAAAASALALMLLSYFVFGPEAWSGFIAVSPLARAALENEWVGSAKMQSAFAALRVLHAGLGLAYAVQALVSLTALAGLVWLARTRPTREGYGVALVAASLLASPFLLDYDLVLLAIPLAWTLREGLTGGFQPYEKSVLFAGFVLPMVSRQLATNLSLPIAPLVLLAIFVIVVRRIGETRRSPQRIPNARVVISS